jgi:hypothetical protein
LELRAQGAQAGNARIRVAWAHGAIDVTDFGLEERQWTVTDGPPTNILEAHVLEEAASTGCSAAAELGLETRKIRFVHHRRCLAPQYLAEDRCAWRDDEYLPVGTRVRRRPR